LPSGRARRAREPAPVGGNVLESLKAEATRVTLSDLGGGGATGDLAAQELTALALHLSVEVLVA
jgi:hypothetical protein